MSDPRPGLLELVCASANPDKVSEIAEILAEVAPWIELVPRPPHLGEVIEDAPDLEGNARLKALAVCSASGLPAVADDTGLEVEALDGRPGVHSARYAGEAVTHEENVVKLLAELDAAGAHDPSSRRARFRTVALVRWPDGSEVMAEGAVIGHMAIEARGSQGFGYDPVFVPGLGEGGDGRTFGEMSATEKHELSHRRRALESLARALGGPV